jgi:thiol-disulfide isomerase/thioredoxin
MKTKLIFLFSIIVTFNLHAQKGLKTLFDENIMTSLDGTQKSLSEIINSHKGKVIFIDFWASWCASCRVNMPAAAKLFEKLKGEDIVFVYLSADKQENNWKKAIETMSISGIGEHYRRDQDEMTELMKFLYIYSIPHYLIVGKDGQLVNRDALHPGELRLEKQLRKLLSRR